MTKEDVPVMLDERRSKQMSSTGGFVLPQDVVALLVHVFVSRVAILLIPISSRPDPVSWLAT